MYHQPIRTCQLWQARFIIFFQLVPVTCAICRKNFCLRHRHENNHDCINLASTSSKGYAFCFQPFAYDFWYLLHLYGLWFNFFLSRRSERSAPTSAAGWVLSTINTSQVEIQWSAPGFPLILFLLVLGGQG